MPAGDFGVVDVVAHVQAAFSVVIAEAALDDLQHFFRVIGHVFQAPPRAIRNVSKQIKVSSSSLVRTYRTYVQMLVSCLEALLVSCLKHCLNTVQSLHDCSLLRLRYAALLRPLAALPGSLIRHLEFIPSVDVPTSGGRQP